MNWPHECDNGWEDREELRPCPICRPWWFDCETCGTSRRDCAEIVGKCCSDCPHVTPSLGKPVRRRPRWIGP